MILNKASFERGFAHASVYKCEVHAGRMYFTYLYQSKQCTLHVHFYAGAAALGGGGG